MNLTRMALPHRKLFVLLLLACVATIPGCKRGPAMARVRGKVTYKDGSIPQGGVAVVRFSPTKDSTAKIRKGASGAIGPDGSFEMLTRKPGDGVYLGEYTVTFVVLRNAMDPTSSVIQPKYNVPSMSPYKEKIDGNKDDLHYEIEPQTAPAPGNKSS